MQVANACSEFMRTNLLWMQSQPQIAGLPGLLGNRTPVSMFNNGQADRPNLATSQAHQRFNNNTSIFWHDFFFNFKHLNLHFQGIFEFSRCKFYQCIIGSLSSQNLLFIFEQTEWPSWSSVKFVQESEQFPIACSWWNPTTTSYDASYVILYSLWYQTATMGG